MSELGATFIPPLVKSGAWMVSAPSRSQHQCTLPPTSSSPPLPAADTTLPNYLRITSRQACKPLTSSTLQINPSFKLARVSSFFTKDPEPQTGFIEQCYKK